MRFIKKIYHIKSRKWFSYFLSFESNWRHCKPQIKANKSSDNFDLSGMFVSYPNITCNTNRMCGSTWDGINLTDEPGMEPHYHTYV